MEGGKVVPYQAELFTLGKVLGTFAGITFFSIILSFILSDLTFNPIMFMILFCAAIVLHLVIRGMVKRRWL